MGATCSHERLTKGEVLYSSVRLGGLVRTEVRQVTCLDCPHFKALVEEQVGAVTGHVYKRAKVSQDTCDHPEYEVDADTQCDHQEWSSFGGAMRFFMGAGMDGIQYTHAYRAHAKCVRCGYVFWVRASSKDVWRDQHQVRERSSPWTPVEQPAEVVRRSTTGDTTTTTTRRQQKYVPVPQEAQQAAAVRKQAAMDAAAAQQINHGDGDNGGGGAASAATAH